MKTIIKSLLLLLLCSQAWATITTFQDGVSPTAGYAGTTDNYLRNTAANTNYGTDVSIIISTGSTVRNTIICFDLSSISPGVTVTASTITLRCEDSTATDTFLFYRLLRNWNETQSTWNIYSTGNNWTASGGAYNNSDRNSVISASATVTSDNGFKNITSAQLAADVQDMINNPSINYGWIVIATNSYHMFDTRHATDTTRRPYLTITYTVNPLNKIFSPPRVIIIQ